MTTPPAAMDVRPLSPTDDMVALTGLLHRAYAPLAAMGLNYTATDQSVEKTVERASDGQCFVACQGGAVVGTVTVSGPFDPARHAWARATPWYFRQDMAHFHQFAVEPSCQGQGIGDALLAACEEWARAQGYAGLACDTAVPAAHLIGFYRRRGFLAVDEVQWDGKRYRSVVLLKPVGGTEPTARDGEHRCAVVRTLWTCVQARDWSGMRALLADTATMHWPVTDEHFDDPDAIVLVNALYPEGWSLRLIEAVALANGQVHAVVEVDHLPQRFFCHSRCNVGADGRIAQIVEHWATSETPPGWRNAERLGAYRRGEGQLRSAAPYRDILQSRGKLQWEGDESIDWTKPAALQPLAQHALSPDDSPTAQAAANKERP